MACLGLYTVVVHVVHRGVLAYATCSTEVDVVLVVAQGFQYDCGVLAECSPPRVTRASFASVCPAHPSGAYATSKETQTKARIDRLTE